MMIEDDKLKGVKSAVVAIGLSNKDTNDVKRSVTDLRPIIWQPVHYAICQECDCWIYELFQLLISLT
jgi:hypothetical protein